MLVFGDHRYQLHAESFRRQLLERAARTDSDDLDGLRTLLIQAGQLEQGVADWIGDGSEADPQPRNEAQRITDCAAVAFYQLWAECAGAPKIQSTSVASARSQFREALESFSLAHNPLLDLKVPEGFAFYALFPEQYCVAAQKWFHARKSQKPPLVLVVGIRSIGATLSAICLAALRSLGCDARRLTVRPTGPPFSRQLDFCWPPVPAGTAALVVDEGPGLSGSSFVAVANSLSQAGISDIAFLPGHQNPPGTAASPEVRACWARLPQFCATLHDLRWSGADLSHTLVKATLRGHDSGQPASGLSIRDISAGQWRKLVFADESAWPAAATRFERLKYLLFGGETALSERESLTYRRLWKFSGFGYALANGETPSERVLGRAEMLRERGFVGDQPVTRDGFCGFQWINGRRLTAASWAEPDLLQSIAEYLALAKGAEQSAANGDAAITRLSHMLYWNAREAFGEEFAERTRELEQAARNCGLRATYGDGRMDPYEWVRTAAGRIVKTNPYGHDCDHTLIGAQSVLWDVASLICEWRLDEPQTNLVRRVLHQHGLRFGPESLRFYEAAYSAFRFGLMTLCAGQEEEGAAEKMRLQRAADFYQDMLRAAV
jgi:hypothetical protein